MIFVTLMTLDSCDNHSIWIIYFIWHSYHM